MILRVRNALSRFSTTPREPPLDPARLPGAARALIAGPRARELTDRYGLHPVQEYRLYLGTLFLVDLLDRVFQKTPRFSALPPQPQLLDVGARDFESAPALYFAFGGRAVLTGIELDAGRRWNGWATAAASAHARLAALGGAPHRYLACDVFAHRERYDVITWIHPFLDEARLLEWGLPRRLFRPREMFQHVCGLRRPGGVLLIVNQEAAENEAQKSLFASAGVAAESFEVPLHFRTRDEPAYVHLV